MATTENLLNGNGSLTDFAFTFPYIKDSDIKVSVGGVAKTVDTHYTLHNATTIKFTSGNIPPSGTNNVRIYRETDDTSLAATFYPGSGIKAGDLNDNFTQNLYVVQEGNNKIDSAWQTGDETIDSTETWHTSDDTRVGTTKAIENRINAKIDTALEGDVLAGTDLAKTASGGQVTINHSVSGANSTINNSNGTVIQDITITAQGHVTSAGSYDLDNRYYTKTESDAAYFNVSTGDTIKDGDTFPDNDTTIATTAAINDRIVDLVTEVGGFVPIANELSFPNTNPDVNDGAGTLVSIKALSTAYTSNGSGSISISNGTVGNSTVTITGLENSTTYASTLGMIVETTSTLNTYAFHRVTPKATEVTTVASSITNVNNVGGSISNVNTVAGVSSNITTVAGIASNVTTVAGIASNVTAVANDATDIGAVAGKATEIGRLGTTDAVSDLNILGTAEVVSDLDACATNITNINAVGSNANNINAVAGQILFSEDLGGIADALTTGTGNNINTCASNLTSINSFAETYRIASSAPSSSLNEGDLWYDSTANVLKYYNGTTWTVTAAAGLSEVVGDTSPELGGHLDCNNKNLTEVGTVSGDNLQIDFGTLS